MKSNKPIIKSTNVCPECYSYLIFSTIYDGDEDMLSEQRKNHIGYHIKSDDYLLTISAIIDIIRNSSSKTYLLEKQTCKKISNELMFLQKNYKLVER